VDASALATVADSSPRAPLVEHEQRLTWLQLKGYLESDWPAMTANERGC